MTNTEVNELHAKVRRQYEASAHQPNLQQLIERLERSQPSSFDEQARKINLTAEGSANLNRLLRKSTIHLPKPLAAFIVRQLQAHTDSSLPVRP